MIWIFLRAVPPSGTRQLVSFGVAQEGPVACDCLARATRIEHA